MYPHRIRLREPWERSGTTALRRFGLPGTLDATERVFLLLSHSAAVELNGHPLGVVAGEIEIGPLLAERNRVTLDGSAACTEGVALEIRAPAWLAEVRRTGNCVTGVIAGHADGSLDLYALAAGRCAAQATVHAGERFALTLPDVGADESSATPGTVAVELVMGAVVWYRWEETAL